MIHVHTDSLYTLGCYAMADWLARRKNFGPPNWRVQLVIDGERVTCASVGSLADLVGEALFDGVYADVVIKQSR